MDYQSIVNAFSSMACIISVEKKFSDNKRIYRIVTGNDAYIKSIEQPTENMRMFRDTFVPNLEYTDYMVRDLNFEEYCYRSAVEKKCLHSYVYADKMKVWFNMSFIPLESDDEELGVGDLEIRDGQEALQGDRRTLSRMGGQRASRERSAALKKRRKSTQKPTNRD